MYELEEKIDSSKINKSQKRPVYFASVNTSKTFSKLRNKDKVISQKSTSSCSSNLYVIKNAW